MLLLFENRFIVKTFFDRHVEEQTGKSVRLKMDRTSLKNDFKTALTNPYIILLALVVLVTANSLKNDFLSLDDIHFIINNPHMHLPLSKVPVIFTKPIEGEHGKYSSYYRPVLELLYIINYKIWGPNPVGFHLVNIMFHLLSAVFVYKTGLILFENDKKISVLAACLWAVHPVNNEPLFRVAMNENMYGFFIIATIYFFILDKKYPSWFTFTFALFSKQSAIMLPFALCLLSIQKSGFKKGIVSVTPFVGIIVTYSILRLMVINYNLLLGQEIALPLLQRVFTVAAAFSDYLRLLIIPYPLKPFYPARLYSPLHPHTLVAISTIILFSVFVYKLRRDKIMFFLLTSPFLLLLPVILRVDTFQLDIETAYIAERFLYVPTMLYSLFISGLLIKTASEKTKKYAFTGFSVIIMLFTFMTASLCGIWKDEAAFYDKLSKDDPNTAVAHCRRGDILFGKGHFDEAAREYTLAFHPYDSLFGRIARKYPDSPKKICATYNKITPQDTSGYHPVFAEIFCDLNHSADRVDRFVSLTDYQPAFAELHFNLGKVYLAAGNVNKAIRKFKVTLILDPELHEAHYYLAEAYMKKKEYVKASEEFRSAMRSTKFSYQTDR